MPRRRDGVEVIGSALLDKAGGAEHRTIAARLGRPAGTVRGWLRAFARRAETRHAAALRWIHALNLAHEPAPPGSPLTDAAEAIGSAARECRLQLGIRAGPWELAVALTGVLLSDGPRRDPLGI